VSALNGYRSSTYDDAVAPDGSVRPVARTVMEAVLAHDLTALADSVREEVEALGISFASVDGDDSWHVDPVPRAVDAGEWERVAAGLAQRVRALNAFIADVYADRRIVAEGIVPQRVLDSAENLEPTMMGVRPRDGVWIGIAGLDLVRDPAGEWLVLEDNVRTPSGLAYWSAARDALLRRLEVPVAPASLDGIPDALRRVFGDGRLVVMTDGPDNSAHWEHDWVARQLGIPLVVPSDLELRDKLLLHGGEQVDGVRRNVLDVA